MVDRDRDVLRAATMYYLQDATMDVIGRQLGTSRSTVSRMLKYARETGLVEIRLHRPQEHGENLAGAIARTFGVEPHLVPVSDLSGEAARLEQVAVAGAKLLAGWFDSDTVLGVAWGTTTAAVSRHLRAKPTHGSTVVQLNGAANVRTSGIAYAGEIIDAFGQAFDAKVHHFPVPAFFDYAETKRSMWRERTIRRVLEVQARTDIALFGVGAISGQVPSHVYSAGYLDERDVADLDAQGVVGDVCTVFLRADGSYRDIEINARATGPTPAELRRVPRRVCVVAGDAKVAPLLAALRAGVVTDLIVDELTAATLLDRLPPDGEARPAVRPARGDDEGGARVHEA